MHGFAFTSLKTKHFFYVLCGGIWVAAVTAGFGYLTKYESTAGASGIAPVTWPGNAAAKRKDQGFKLVMFLHPHCPCSRASVSELAKLMARAGSGLKADVFFHQPETVAKAWVETGLWAAAAAIPGVTPLPDCAGAEAKRFHAMTSGDCFLYNQQGQLLFHGGINAARSHEGDNAGESAILSLVRSQSAEIRQTRVFGCSLFGTASAKGAY